jgi:hypothetical protein
MCHNVPQLQKQAFTKTGYTVWTWLCTHLYDHDSTAKMLCIEQSNMKNVMLLNHGEVNDAKSSGL